MEIFAYIIGIHNAAFCFQCIDDNSKNISSKASALQTYHDTNVSKQRNRGCRTEGGGALGHGAERLFMCTRNYRSAEIASS